MIPLTIPTDIPNVSVLATEPSTNLLQPVRHKVKHACSSCKERKVRCDGSTPCASCLNTGLKCEYVLSAKRVKKKRKIDFVAPEVPQAEHQASTLMKSNTRKVEVDYKSVLHSLFPDVNLSQPNLSTVSLVSLIRSAETQPNLQVQACDRKLILPPKQIALTLISKAWYSACLLFRFYHRPNFISVVESLYSVKDSEYSAKQSRFLPLVYSVIAVGALFCKSYSETTHQKQMMEFFQDEGHKYFVEAKSLLDPLDCQDIESLQALFMLAIFLQCNANLSSGYSYIGMALRTAIKQNYHRKTSLQHLTLLQQETVKKLFWTIYKTDIYMNCILGLPNSLDESFIDQEFPRDVDDDRILDNEILQQPSGKLSSVGMNNEHTKLILIMNDTHKILYPMSLTVTSISHDAISKLEGKLASWLKGLPFQLQPDFVPTNEESLPYLKPNRYLHLDFLHVQIMLYRPFIHYLVLDAEKFPSHNFQILMANKCINTARKVIRLAVEMDQQEVLNAVYWFSIHTIFFSVACLLYFLHQMKLKDSKLIDADTEKDFKDGFNLLLKLKNVSLASSKTFEVLNSLFEKLNQKTMELSDTVLTTIIAKQKQNEFEAFTKLSDLFMENEIEENLFETGNALPPSLTEFDNDFLNKILSQFFTDID
ncbi:unnamed protein product [Kluyveromyces dobzhanskii CBS 2104]|uniref:WGS project CCBQ000000000 data, contig MAT n=1 Tax=Kluyveromyces dobzhanskii CBS 2104 TaxID=1427455 RepID=A0A0A8L1S3_9SACH|nr:unnamed protein product [Kluyveromyces dobzhanskii CBS 2104]